MNDPISVLLVDDHALVLELLHGRLDREPDMRVSVAVGDADAAVDEAGRHLPDVIVMDIDMPGLACFEAVRAIRSVSPDSRILFLSSFTNDAYIDQALALEASGYLTKSEPPEAVVAAVRIVAAGQRAFSQEVRRRIVIDGDSVKLAGKQRSRMSTLTARELEVLRYLARGHSQKEIARITCRSVNTIHNHCTKIMMKLDIHDRAELVRFALREGLTEA